MIDASYVRRWTPPQKTPLAATYLLALPLPKDRRNCEVEGERGVVALMTAAVRAAEDLVGDVRVDVDGDSRSVARSEAPAGEPYKLVADVEDGGPRADSAPL